MSWTSGLSSSSRTCSAMINTYQTSLAPPPVPPRDNRPVLIQAPLPSRGHSKPLIRFLVCVVVAHLFLSLAAFVYLYLKHHTEKSVQTEEKGGMTGLDSRSSSLSSEKRQTSTRVSANMVIDKRVTQPKKSAGHLEWDMKNSALKKIGYYAKSWLTIEQPGDYYVYSRVTFSRGDPVHPLVSMVKLRKDKNGEERVAMQAFCSLDSGDPSIPNMCTASQGGLITLETGNQLGVWVHNLSLVDYVETTTSFGMYKVWDS
ncbi:CD40 ligand [Salarias fasciatus]|uniref:Uncharacterized LOC115398089 n=1 Tax=Salarias fasciatus TaxID=181472 RepID=A0A672J9V9_SALFA|nr:uncharacterized protein LOC115398089 [Salarias fasciatus]